MARLFEPTLPLAAVITLLLAVREAEPRVLQRADAPGWQTGESVLGVFEGRTPCGPIALQFTNFPAQHCEQVKWKLTLYREAISGAPTRYEFKGSRGARRGAWTIVHGTARNRDATVYRLAFGTHGGAVSFQAVDDRVLLLLDNDMRPLVGDASWSYTLNRTGP
jgi:hypothetical protein